jgi:hypothetical protein
MKIQDLLLKEVMNSDGFPIKRVSTSSWNITIPSESTKTNKSVIVVVDTPTEKIDDYSITELSFRIAGTTQIQLENIFADTEVFKLFSSLRMIVEQLHTDIVVFIPNDLVVDIGNKKARVYTAVMNRMRTRGSLARIETISDPSGHKFLFAFPTTSAAVSIDQDELIGITAKYFGTKV